MRRRVKQKPGLIAGNPRARHDYYIEKTYEAGLSLLGWEVKSLRSGRLSLKGSFVQMRNQEAFLIASHVSPLDTCPSYMKADATRARKLLLNKIELRRLYAALEQQGYSLIPVRAYWRKNRAKLEVGLGKGKKLHDKRAASRERDWAREKERVLKKDIKL